MPLYEYQCDACSHRFEVIQKFSDPLVQVCPSCGGTVKKLFSSPAIQFKGSGWYITDYARKSGTGSGSAKSGESGEKSGGSAASNESSSGSSKSAGDSSSKEGSSKDGSSSSSSSSDKAPPKAAS